MVPNQVRDLAPLGARGDEKAVPILTTDEGIGARRLLADVHSAINGCARGLGLLVAHDSMLPRPAAVMNGIQFSPCIYKMPSRRGVACMTVRCCRQEERSRAACESHGGAHAQADCRGGCAAAAAG